MRFRWSAVFSQIGSPYRSRLNDYVVRLIAQISDGCTLGPPEDGGLLPLGWLPPGWPHAGERNPAAPFPLEQAWYWETDPAPLGQDGEALIPAAHLHGSVLLGSEQGDDWILVTAGPLRGQVLAAMCLHYVAYMVQSSTPIRDLLDPDQAALVFGYELNRDADRVRDEHLPRGVIDVGQKAEHRVC